MPEYFIPDLISIAEGSSHKIMFLVSSNPPLPDDTTHELCLLRENYIQFPVPKRFTVNQNTIAMNNVSCEDSGTYQISCTTKEGLIGKATFAVSVIGKFSVQNCIIPNIFSKRFKYKIKLNM